MIEKILPKRYATHNCIENCIANLCDSADINFFPLFLFSWDFGYDTSQSTIGKRIHHHNSCDIGLENYFYISEKYFNIHFSPIPNGSKITDELVNRESCLLIGIDSFECPWNLTYQKYHYPHFYILKSREIYGYCAIDSFCCSDPINVDIDTLCKSERLYTVNFHKSNIPPQKRLLLREFCERLKTNVKIEIFETIKKFGFDLSQINQ